MKLTEKIDSYLEYNDMKLSDFARKSGIPYTTLRGLYDKGYEKTKMQTLMKLKDVMQVTLDDLCDDSIDINFSCYNKEEKTSINSMYSDLSLRQIDIIETIIKAFRVENDR